MNRRFFLKASAIVATTVGLANTKIAKAKPKARSLEEVKEYCQNVFDGKVSPTDFFHAVMAMSDVDFLIHIKIIANFPYGSPFLCKIDEQFERRMWIRLREFKKENSAMFRVVATSTILVN